MKASNTSIRSINPHYEPLTRASLISPTPSVEADDERDSSWDDSLFDMDDLEDPVHATRFADEDTRPTSQKELWGWYSYGWAAEVFAICAMGASFIIPHALRPKD